MCYENLPIFLLPRSSLITFYNNGDIVATSYILIYYYKTNQEFNDFSPFSFQVLHDTGVHHLRLLHILGRLALLLFFPVWLFFDFRNVINEKIFVSMHSFDLM